MKYVFFIISFLFLQSCSSTMARTTPKKRGIDETFKPYIKSYEFIIKYNNDKNFSKYKDRINKLSMNFSKLEGNTIGRCYWLLNGEFEIEIDKRWWNRRNGELSKQFLIYHELEHCVRFRMHTHTKDGELGFLEFLESLAQSLGLIKKSGYFKDGCPDSIMHPTDNGEYCSYLHYEDYIKEIYLYDK